MPLHARRQIVTAAVAALMNLPTTADRVKAGRAAPLPVAQAPYLLVYARREQAAPATMKGAARSLQRQLSLWVDAVTASADDNDELADAIALEVEQALAGDPTLGGVCRDLFLSGTDMDARHEGESRTGRARFEFTVIYFTAANRPDASL